MTLLQEITEACRAAVRAFVSDRTDKEGRVSSDALANFARSMRLVTPAYEKSLKVHWHLGSQCVAAMCPVLTSMYQAWPLKVLN